MPDLHACEVGDSDKCPEVISVDRKCRGGNGRKAGTISVELGDFATHWWMVLVYGASFPYFFKFGLGEESRFPQKG